MRERADLIGKHFGRWFVLERTLNDVRGKTMWLCACSCGTRRIVAAAALLRGSTKSCGCLLREITAIRSTTHGHTKATKPTRAYVIWKSMKRRCVNPTCKEFKNYGARGIRVCERWINFEDFLRDMGNPPQYRWLERINNDGDYELDNCRWATRKEQMRNKRTNRLVTIDDETLCIAEWSERSGVKEGTIWYRLKIGVTGRAIIKPVSATAQSETPAMAQVARRA